MLNIQSCIIVGSGISGLMAAHKLREYAVDLTLVEKGRAPGGRMATRKEGDAIFDHGAQFVTTRELAFRERVESWVDKNAVKPWYVGPLGNMRYVGITGMRSIPDLLTKGMNVAYSEKVTKIHFKKDVWTVTVQPHGSKATKTYKSDFLVLTAPVPQSLQLIRESNIELDYDEEEELSRIKYIRCISVLAKLKGPAGLPNPGAMDLNHDVLRWIGDNCVKGISPVEGSITLHSSPKFADRYWDAPDEERIPLMLAAAKPFLKSDVVETSSHRWGFSEPTRIYKEKQPFRVPYFLDEDHRLALCGDGFNGPRIEAAAISGANLADRLVRPY